MRGRFIRPLAMSLATTLTLIAIVVTLAFTLATAGLANLNLGRRAHNAQVAHNLAESAVALAIERVMADPTYGTHPQRSETVSVEGHDGGLGTVSFVSAPGEPWSTNNLDSDTSVPGYADRVVPGGAVHLVGRGRFRGAEQRVEVVVAVPPYPFAIAADGPIESSGGLLVGSAADPETWTADTLQPADLASNFGAEVAVRLGPDSRIEGDVRTPGGVALERGALVRGLLQEHSQPVEIPQIALSDYDPARLHPTGLQTLSGGFLSSPNLQGFCLSPGPLRVYGALNLRGALLYVKGDLFVDGGITGTGCVVVEGDTILASGTSLQADNVAALLSGGSIRVLPGGSYFQGLIYCEGGFEASDLTLFGSLLARSGDSCQGVKLTNSRVIQSPRYSRVIAPVGAPQANLYFKTSGEMAADGESRDALAALLVRPNPSGTFYVYDAALAMQADNLSRNEAVDYIVSLLQAHQNDDIQGERRLQLWERLGELSQAQAQTTTSSTLSSEVISVDPNQFIQLKDKARVVLWRNL